MADRREVIRKANALEGIRNKRKPEMNTMDSQTPANEEEQLKLLRQFLKEVVRVWPYAIDYRYLCTTAEKVGISVTNMHDVGLVPLDIPIRKKDSEHDCHRKA